MPISKRQMDKRSTRVKANKKRRQKNNIVPNGIHKIRWCISCFTDGHYVIWWQKSWVPFSFTSLFGESFLLFTSWLKVRRINCGGGTDIFNFFTENGEKCGFFRRLRGTILYPFIYLKTCCLSLEKPKWAWNPIRKSISKLFFTEK